MKTVLKTKTLEDELLEIQKKIENELFRIRQKKDFRDFDERFFKNKKD